jgi:hypothetical protein
MGWVAASGFLLIAVCQSAGDGRVEGWQQDLALLARELPKLHKNFFFARPREEFEAQVAELQRALPELRDDEAAVEFMRLVAATGDGHTSVQPGNGPLPWTHLPLRLRRFGDELRVVEVARAQAGALGGRVVAIGGVGVDEAWRRVGEIVAHENEASLSAFAPSDLEIGFVLSGLHLAPDAKHATFDVEVDGARKSFEFTPSSPVEEALGRLALPAKEKRPPWLAHPEQSYWFEYEPGSRLLYIQYNHCRDEAAAPFGRFCDELMDSADAHDVAKVVIDLRQNGGGDSSVIAPLYRALGARRKLREKGRLFVAIGPGTFSSAMMNAIELKNGFGAILVGEPTGGKPNAYGEIRFLDLPKSRLRISYSTKYFQQVPGDPPSVEPDVAAPLTFADFESGRDPVVAAALAWKPPAVSSGKE